jgi:hypothetical protein
MIYGLLKCSGLSKTVRDTTTRLFSHFSFGRAYAAADPNATVALGQRALVSHSKKAIICTSLTSNKTLTANDNFILSINPFR